MSDENIKINFNQPETPHTCPRCNGQKHIWTPPQVPGDQETYTSGSLQSYKCPVCNGSGVLWR